MLHLFLITLLCSQITMNNQKSSANSRFKTTQISQPLSTQIETLLFNDILEEISTTMRNELSEFLQVQPYHLFKNELAIFTKHINRLKQEGLQNGTNRSRVNNFSKTNSRPSSNFNRRTPSTMSLIRCHTNITIRQPENNVRPIVPLNLSETPVDVGFQSKNVVLPHINQSSYASQSSSKMVEVNHGNNNTAETNDNCEHLNLSEPVLKYPSGQKNAYSDTTIVVENKSVSALHQHFELPDNNKTTKGDTDENNGNLEKYLSKWSINMKIDKCKQICVILTGTLLEADKSTLIEKHHNAGIIISRKKKDLLKTNNGLYCLVGNIISGSPEELYQGCLSKKGFPLRWKIILGKYYCDGEKIKKAVLNVSFNSPGAPITSIKPMNQPINLDINMTRTGKMYSPSILSNRKRKMPADEVSDKNKTSYAKFKFTKLPSFASTPNIPKKPCLINETPTQNLKNILHKTNSLVQKKIDDSINITKKRWSYKKEQAGELLKRKSTAIPLQLSNTNSIKQLERNFTVGDSSLKNITQPTSKSSENSSTTMISNSSKQQSSLELSGNFSKSSINQTSLSEKNVEVLQQIKPVKAKSIKITTIVKPNISIHEFKKKINNSLSLRDQVPQEPKKVRCSPGSDVFGELL